MSSSIRSTATPRARFYSWQTTRRGISSVSYGRLADDDDPAPLTAEVRAPYVDATCRRRGIGAALLRQRWSAASADSRPSGSRSCQRTSNLRVLQAHVWTRNWPRDVRRGLMRSPRPRAPSKGTRRGAVQYTCMEGPCVDSLRKAPTVAVKHLRHDQRWPHYVPDAVPEASARSWRSGCTSMSTRWVASTSTARSRRRCREAPERLVSCSRHMRPSRWAGRSTRTT